MLDALSRLPHSPHPQGNVDGSFPDDTTSRDPSAFVGPRASTLQGGRLADLEPLTDGDIDPPTRATSMPAPPVASTPTDAIYSARPACLPFATCAALEAQRHPRGAEGVSARQASDAAPPTRRCCSRRRVRLALAPSPHRRQFASPTQRHRQPLFLPTQPRRLCRATT